MNGQWKLIIYGLEVIEGGGSLKSTPFGAPSSSRFGRGAQSPDEGIGFRVTLYIN